MYSKNKSSKSESCKMRLKAKRNNWTKKESLEKHAVAVNKEMVKNKELELDVRRLKRKVQQWEEEEEDHRRRVKQVKIERERREKMEADIKVRVRIEEYERERVRDEIFHRRQRRRYRKWSDTARLKLWWNMTSITNLPLWGSVTQTWIIVTG